MNRKSCFPKQLYKLRQIKTNIKICKKVFKLTGKDNNLNNTRWNYVQIDNNTNIKNTKN